MFCVYVLKSFRNGRVYVGHTNNLARRIIEHNSGHTISTHGKGPFEVVYFEEFSTKIAAVHRERYLKSGQGREERKKLGL